MTDRLTPGQLRDLADLIWGRDLPTPPNYLAATVQIEIAEGLRNSAARREPEEREANRLGEGSDVERTAEEDALLFKGVDAPPPPAPENPVQELYALRKEVRDLRARAEAAEARVRELEAAADKRCAFPTGDCLHNSPTLRCKLDAAEADAKRLREAIERYLTAKHDLRQAGKQDEHEPYRAALIEYDKAEQSLSAALAQGGNDG